MSRCRNIGLICILGVHLSAQNLSAGWKTSRVDRIESPYIHFDGDLAAYTRDDDLIVYRMSSNQQVNVTDDQDAWEDTALRVSDGIVWFLSTAYGDPNVTRLRQHLPDLSRTNLLYTTESEISLSKASADAGRLVVLMEDDWWIWDQSQMKRITFGGTGSGKHEPRLSGNHLLWREGETRVMVTHVPSGESTLLSEEGMENRSLQLCNEHAAWVRQDSTDRYRIIYHRLGSEEFGAIGMCDQGAAAPMYMDSEGLVYVMSWGSYWFIMHFRFEEPTLEVLLQTSLALESPYRYEDKIFFLAQSCSTGMCLELFSLDTTTGSLSQITTYGSASYVLNFGAGPNGVLFSRFFLPLPGQYDIFQAKEVPGLACGTLSDPVEQTFPLSLFLLLGPALFTRALRFLKIAAKPDRAVRPGHNLGPR